MKKRFFTKLLLAASPLLLVGIMYLWLDPYRVLYHYTNFYDSTKKNEWYRNTDYVATELLLNNYKTYQYDSYIFGSSRSDVFLASVWGPYVHATHCYHYSSHRECLFGMAGKVALLHSKGMRIKHALFVIDYQLLSVTTNLDGPIFRKHPLVSGESQLRFQLAELKTYAALFFQPSYLHWLLVRGNYDLEYDAANNEEHWWVKQDAAIARQQDSFYKARDTAFYKRNAIQQYAPHVIRDTQIKMLTRIKHVLDIDSTDYRIIVSPLYDQKKMDSTDLAILQSLFGRENVFDFSGINAITESKYNYYEASHFKPGVATELLHTIYKK